MEPLHGLRVLALALAAFAFSLSFSAPAQAKVFLTVNEALAKAFPAVKKCKTEAQTHYLTQEQRESARKLAGLDIPSSLVVRYAAACDGKPAGYAYTDIHRVRTHPEALFLTVSAEGKVDRVEVLSFDEPLEYIPRSEWYGTFQTTGLDESLRIKRKIPFVTGASLTSTATVQATRRTLAIDQVLRPSAK